MPADVVPVSRALSKRLRTLYGPPGILLPTILKLLFVVSLLLLFSLLSLLLTLLPAGRARRRRLLTRNTSYFSRQVLRVLGIRARYRKRGRHPVPDRSSLIVANHVSYIDILAIASLRPSVFITSIELRNTFPLGMLARFGGSIFVERRNPAGLKQEIRDIENVLRSGSSVVLFPEGTTSDGETVLSFRNSLFTAATATGVPVLPLCLRYRRINGKRITKESRESVYYHGKTTFSAHVPRLLALRSVHMDCILLDPIETRHGMTRKELAAKSHDLIKSEYHRSIGRSG
jgi:1-acyl-sn-glycerol-3-phosphate acyltransferase